MPVEVEAALMLLHRPTWLYRMALIWWRYPAPSPCVQDTPCKAVTAELRHVQRLCTAVGGQTSTHKQGACYAQKACTVCAAS